MALSSFEVNMQTIASVLSGCLKEKNCVPTMTKDGITQMVKENFPHFETEEIRPGVYRIRVMKETCPQVSQDEFQEENNARVPEIDFTFDLDIPDEVSLGEFLLELDASVIIR